jgi:membrane protein
MASVAGPSNSARSACRCAFDGMPVPRPIGVLREAVRSGSEHRLVDEAGAVAFFAVLALFPALAALVSFYGLFADPVAVSLHLGRLGTVLPGDAMAVVGEQARRLALRDRETLGLGAAASLAGALWSANRATRTLFNALGAIDGGREARCILARITLTLAFTLGGILFAALAIGAVVALPIVLRAFGLGGIADILLRLLRWPLLLVGVAFFLACIYRYAPGGAKVRWRWVSWGGAAAALAWLSGSAAFSWYVGELGSFDRTYGPLGAAIGFMIWFWLSAAVVLAGGVLNVAIRREMEKAAGARE